MKIKTLIQKSLVFPKLQTNPGKSAAMARQLDVALMSIGFKLSHDLYEDIAQSTFEDALQKSSALLEAARELVGGHVQHNVYFINFPQGIPDTEEFWFREIVKWFFTGDCDYGRYMHSYEEMLAAHKALKLKHPKFKVINLGKSLEEETHALFASLAQSKVPLAGDDLELLHALCCPQTLKALEGPIPVRENKAIINARRFGFKLPLELDTPLDLLRVACVLSKGDVTLAKPTKFTSFPRSMRRFLLENLDRLLSESPAKAEDISNYKEPFKRLAEKLHPREFPALKHAQALFDYAFGTRSIETLAHKVQHGIQTGKFNEAIGLLGNKPGQLVRSLDKILRECSDEDFKLLCETLRSAAAKVSGRVLLSFLQHLDNREAGNISTRIFVNKQGRGYAMTNSLPAIGRERLKAVRKLLTTEIANRIPEVQNLIVAPGLEQIALPLTEKNQSDGFHILPRGSRFTLDKSKNRLRFFIHWHQAEQRTDYDLSCLFLDKDFNFIEHISWRNLGRADYGVHSGDITSAPDGASEFIELYINKLPSNVRYLIPTVDVFAGEDFTQVKEAMFGFMERSESEAGKPFEEATVKTKFNLRGSGKVALPMVFFRTADGFDAKWIDLTCKGLSFGNQVATNRVSTSMLAKSVFEKEYLPLSFITDLMKSKAAKVLPLTEKKLATPGVVYIGLTRPEGLDASAKVYTLENLRDLIPA